MQPVRKSIQVPLAPEQAFALFTTEMSLWWPMREYSAGQEKTVRVVVENRVGGRVYEVQADGKECAWGTVVAWDPPRVFSMTWHPGRAASTAQEVEVRFLAAEDGGTRVELEHRGWEALGERAADQRRNYDGGWETVLGCYVTKAKRGLASARDE
jgi:hypothetical protein